MVLAGTALLAIALGKPVSDEFMEILKTLTG
jgi:hypothetical protein